MQGLIPAFVAALLGEAGERTQLLAAYLAKRFGRPGPVLAGIAIAAILNAAIAGAGGALLAGIINHRAASLFLALALLFGGAGMFFPVKPPPEEVDAARFGAVAGSFFASFVLAFGDKTQFITLALAAESGAPWLVAAGAAAGVIAASVPAVMIGPAIGRSGALRAVRIGANALFLLIGAIVAVNALGLT